MKLISLSFQERFRLYVLDPIRFAVDPYKLDLPDAMEMTEEEFEIIDSLLPIRQAITGALLSLRFGPEWIKDEVHAALNSYLSVLMTMTYNDGLSLLRRKYWPFEDEFWWMVEIGNVTPEQPIEVDDYVLRESVEMAAERYPDMPYSMKLWFDDTRMNANHNQRKLSEVFMARYNHVLKKMETARKEGHESDNHWKNLHQEQEKVVEAWKEALLALK